MNLVCPVCGSEYLSWVSRCASCGVALVAPGEAPNPLELPEEEQVVYELGSWPLDSQAEAAAALAESGIPHAFSGTDLVVHLDHEEAVDAMLDEIEDAAGGFDAADGGEDEPGELVYELEGWTEEHRTDLEARLAAGGVPYRIEDDGLAVAARDEAAVDFLVAEVRGEVAPVRRAPDGEVFEDRDGDGEPDEPLAGDEGADDDRADDDGADDGGELVSALFDVAARLERRPEDSDGLVEFAALNSELDPERPPFGMNQRAWDTVIEAADDLADALTGEGGPEDAEGPDGDLTGGVVLAARRLRAVLRPFV